jgi:hypothetical protein
MEFSKVLFNREIHEEMEVWKRKVISGDGEGWLIR